MVIRSLIRNHKTYKQSNCSHQIIPPVSIITHKQVICIRWFTTNSKQFQEIMKLPIHISADGDWTSNFLYTGLFFFFLVSISLAFLQRLLTWDADSCSIHLSTSLVNTFSSVMSPAWTGYRSLLLLLVPSSRCTCACTGGCSALALALWLIPLCPATGHCPPPLTLGLTLCSL